MLMTAGPVAAEPKASAPGASAAAKRLNIGRVAKPEEIAGWDIDIRPDGHGLRALNARHDASLRPASLARQREAGGYRSSRAAAAAGLTCGCMLIDMPR